MSLTLQSPSDPGQPFRWPVQPMWVHRPDSFADTNPTTGFPDVFHVTQAHEFKFALNTAHTASGYDEADGPNIPYLILEARDGRMVPITLLLFQNETYYDTKTLVQPIAPGVYARWFVQYGTGWSNQDATFLLVRLEGPGLVKYPGTTPTDQYNRAGGMFGPAYRGWLWDSIVNPPTSAKLADGSVLWMDGAGVPYGRALPDGSWEVAVLDIWHQTVPWGRDENEPTLRGADLAAFVK
ncbi:MAG: hypothetical protein WCK25_05680, partial [Actinomycetes bacterium]